MKIEFVKDIKQYDSSFVMLKNAAERLGIRVTENRYCSASTDVDLSIATQNFALATMRRPTLFLPHGLSLMKKFSLKDYAKLFDGVIAPSTYLGSELENTQNKMNLVGLGHPRIDYLLRLRKWKHSLKDEIVESYNLPNLPLILYAPTWKNPDRFIHAQRNNTLDEVEKNLGNRFVVMNMIHELETTDEVKSLKFKVERTKNAEYLAACDVVITDTSGIAFEAAALGIPTIMIDSGIQGYFEDKVSGTNSKIVLGPQVSIEDLADAVDGVIHGKDDFAEERKFWAERALGPCDGNASDRILKEITDLDLFSRRKGGIKLKKHRPEADLVPIGISYIDIDVYTHSELLRSIHTIRHKISEGIPSVQLTSNEIVCGEILFGPYISLLPGNYLLQISLNSKCPLEVLIRYRVENSEGSQFVDTPLGRTANTSASMLEFEVPTGIAENSIEFIFVQSEAEHLLVTFTDYRIFRRVDGTTL